jgi:uncharacterized protein (DUF302 family)
MKLFAHNAMAATVVMAALVIAPMIGAGPAQAGKHAPYPGTRIIETPHSYQKLVKDLAASVRQNRMGVVNRASATLGAKSLGIKIPGNMVIGVFAPKFAVRMLRASVPAGFEAPLRFYITENADGTATLTYRTPSSVFAPYGSAELDKMAKELDGIFSEIAAGAAKP